MAQRRFLYNDESIENVKSFCYVGIVMSKYGNFNNAKKHMVEQASKALYGVFLENTATNWLSLGSVWQGY